MFSGQGSQYYHMGKELYENHARFRLWMDHCDDIAYSFLQASLIDHIYDKHVSKSDPFDRVLYTNPALLCIEYSLAQILMEMHLQPDYLLGYSLGEITAAVISGAVSLEDGIQLTVDYARLLERGTLPARMLAIIGSTDITTQFPGLFQKCWITGRNFQNNFVVSGLPKDIHDLQEALNQKNILTQKLPVNYGFHTELMDPIENEFKQLVRRVNAFPIRIPTISALKTETVEEINADYFWKVTRHPVEFEKTICSMLQGDDYIFIDVGPSGTLATFIKYLLPSHSGSVHLEVINQFGKDINTIEKLKAKLPLSDTVLSSMRC